MANNHLKIHPLIGLKPHDTRTFKLQIIKDNLSLLNPEVLDELNALAVTAAYKKLGYEQESIKGHKYFQNDSRMLFCWPDIGQGG